MTEAIVNTHKNVHRKLTRINILNRVQAYGFIECVSIINFLQHVCEQEILNIPELRFIYSRVNECLKQHATYSGRYSTTDFIYYFQDLNALKEELEFVISVSRK